MQILIVYDLWGLHKTHLYPHKGIVHSLIIQFIWFTLLKKYFVYFFKEQKS